jgi:hypothetical protein
VSSSAPAKFFVNQGVVSSRVDMQNVLRPILKQTVSYRFLRGRDLVAHGTGWVERMVVDDDETSTFFTPIAITLNLDSFEHLEFETRPDQLLVYTLVQGDGECGKRGPQRAAAARVRHERLRPDGAPGPRHSRRRVAAARAGAR